MPRSLSSIIVAFWSIHVVTAAEPPGFERDVRPLLKAHCFECHGEGKKAKGGLDVRLKRLLLEGGDSGPAFKIGEGKNSLLVQRLRSGEMPPGKKKLTADEIATITKWIDAGAPTARPEPAKLDTGFHITPEEQAYWFFQPIRVPAIPRVKSGQVHHPIDAFLLARLEAKGLTFSPPADRRTLLRRVSLDLIGLPPTPAEIEAFVRDESPEAYEKVIDRLLASPHYGERWGRHWLDVAGYADSEGVSSNDPVRTSAYRYRDYVIRAFNTDKPFDEFIHEQLAGDEMVAPPYDKLPESQWDRLIATGFLRMAPDGTATKDADIKAASNQNVADTVQIVGSALLGLTVHCAQCHNHRYDPIPQADYYRMRAIFEPALDPKNWRLPAVREIGTINEERRRQIEAVEEQARKVDQERVEKTKAWVKAVFDKALAAVPAGERDAVQQALKKAASARNAEQKALLAKYKGITVDAATVGAFDPAAKKGILALVTQAQKIRQTKPLPESIRATTEIPGKVPTTFLFDRGDPDQPKEELTPGHLTILAPFGLPAIPVKDPKLPSTGRRLAFARSLTAPTHPLTARVLVNRFWMHHFGRGLVSTPGDFGHLGERPSHPELLDWLAHDFMTHGWRLKRFHKQILLSAAYRQASYRTPELQSVDPDDHLLGRMPLRRLEAEIVRDAMLATAGRLNAKPFGPPVPIRPDEAGQIVIGVDTNDGAGRPTGKFVPLNGDEFRRSLYVQVRRSRPLAMLETFDGARLNPNCDLRNASTVTPQSLLLMNSRDVLEMADMLAQRLEKEAGPTTSAQVALAWNLVFTAEPTTAEREGALRFLAEQTAELRRAKSVTAPERSALANLCQAMLSSNRFLYVD